MERSHPALVDQARPSCSWHRIGHGRPQAEQCIGGPRALGHRVQDPAKAAAWLPATVKTIAAGRLRVPLGDISPFRFERSAPVVNPVGSVVSLGAVVGRPHQRRLVAQGALGVLAPAVRSYSGRHLRDLPGGKGLTTRLTTSLCRARRSSVPSNGRLSDHRPG